MWREATPQPTSSLKRSSELKGDREVCGGLLSSIAVFEPFEVTEGPHRAPAFLYSLTLP
jgi:hypothetical protein